MYKRQALDANNWYYQADVLSAALKAALEANSTTVKNSLEAYVKNNGGTATVSYTHLDVYKRQAIGCISVMRVELNFLR